MASPKDYSSLFDSQRVGLQYTNVHNYPTLAYSGYSANQTTTGYYHGCDVDGSGSSNFPPPWGHSDQAALSGETLGGLGNEGSYVGAEFRDYGGAGDYYCYEGSSYYDWSSSWAYLARTMDPAYYSSWGSAGSSWLVTGGPKPWYHPHFQGANSSEELNSQYNAAVAESIGVKQESCEDSADQVDYERDYDVVVKLHRDNLHSSSALQTPSTFICQVYIYFW